MRKGEIVRAALLVMALALALTGSWGLLVFGAVIYQLARVAAMTLERRSQQRRPALGDGG